VQRLTQELKSTKESLQTARQHEPRAVAMQSQVADLTVELKRVSSELDQSLDANAEMQERMRVLEGKLHESAAVMRDLRRKRAHVPVLESNENQRRAA